LVRKIEWGTNFALLSFEASLRVVLDTLLSRGSSAGFAR
jgi:hypothetical protein